MTMRRTLAPLAAAVIAIATLAGCAAPSDPAPRAGAPAGRITVFAAASLTGTFTALADAFETQHPGTTIALTFAGSSSLVTQIIEGAPADVFAAADTASMAKLTAAGLTSGDPVEFATNTLVIAVPPGNPAGIAALGDLTGSGIRLVVCAPEVPCGAAAGAAAGAAGLTFAPVSEESSVTGVLGKVSSGEADAGLVYVTDVRAAGGAVEGIPFPESTEAVTTYPIVTVAEPESARLSRAFITYVTSTGGRAVLRAAGFGAP